MASVHRDPRFPKGVWYCHYTLADGRRATRSTGKRRKAEAGIVCQALQQAENEAATGNLAKDRLRELFEETLRRLDPRKSGLAPGTIKSTRHVARNLDNTQPMKIEQATLELTPGECSQLMKSGHIRISEPERGEIEVWMLFDDSRPGAKGKRLRINVVKPGRALKGKVNPNKG